MDMDTRNTSYEWWNLEGLGIETRKSGRPGHLTNLNTGRPGH